MTKGCKASPEAAVASHSKLFIAADRKLLSWKDGPETRPTGCFPAALPPTIDASMMILVARADRDKNQCFSLYFDFDLSIILDSKRVLIPGNLGQLDAIRKKDPKLKSSVTHCQSKFLSASKWVENAGFIESGPGVYT